jgi:P-type Mg2+ transporter
MTKAFADFWKKARDPAQDKRSTEGVEKKLVAACKIPIESLLGEQGTSLQGLTQDEAENRLADYGPNELLPLKHLSIWGDLWHRLRSPLVVQLVIIAAVSGIIGEPVSALIVSAMIVLSVGLSFVLDRRSSSAVYALGRRVQSRICVVRGGKECEVRMSEVVPGDIVVLRVGSIVPADLRLISAKDFFVSESALTGESMPVEKSAECAKATASAYTELPNACFMGTSVTNGTARGVVLYTASNTVFGAISAKLEERRVETSFDRGVRSFTWLMIKFMIVMVSAVFMIVGLTTGNWTEALLFGLSIAVGLTPEMLPMIVTVNLAKGALAMAKKKVIVKRLPSIQNFGAIDILCTDKTGTLTQDRVVLEHHLDIVGNVSEDVLHYAYLNSYFQTGLQSLIDRAVIERANQPNVHPEQGCKLVDELPFDFQRRRMSVVVDYEGDHVLICKGAVEEVYTCCSHYQLDDEVYPLIDMIRADMMEEVERLNRDGFRVLGIGYREFPREKTNFTTGDEKNLILLGYIAFFDPPKASASEAITRLNKSGVRVKVLTGDNGLVTEKVCRDVGIAIGRIVTGGDLSKLSPAEFSKVVSECDIFVKLSPAQKDAIVSDLRKQGHVVGFMGDGINDAPALKTADVGISVDSAADVAKEAADIVLLEKNLLVLEEGIIEGRRVFANIVKYIRMGASSNFGNMFSVVGASYMLPFLPMKPVQILVNNLLYDFSQTGIPTDSVDPELVARPLKWDIGNIKWFMFIVGPISSLFDYATFALMWFFFGCRAYLDPALGADKEHLASLFQTGWFVESLLTQTLIVHIIRTKRIPFIQSCASLPMTLTTLCIMVIGSWLPYSPFAEALGLVRLPFYYWLFIGGFLCCYAVLTNTVKNWFFKRFGGN